MDWRKVRRGLARDVDVRLARNEQRPRSRSFGSERDRAPRRHYDNRLYPHSLSRIAIFRFSCTVHIPAIIPITVCIAFSSSRSLLCRPLGTATDQDMALGSPGRCREAEEHGGKGEPMAYLGFSYLERRVAITGMSVLYTFLPSLSLVSQFCARPSKPSVFPHCHPRSKCRFHTALAVCVEKQRHEGVEKPRNNHCRTFKRPPLVRIVAAPWMRSSLSACFVLPPRHKSE